MEGRVILITLALLCSHWWMMMEWMWILYFCFHSLHLAQVTRQVTLLTSVPHNTFVQWSTLFSYLCFPLFIKWTHGFFFAIRNKNQLTYSFDFNWLFFTPAVIALARLIFSPFQLIRIYRKEKLKVNKATVHILCWLGTGAFHENSNAWDEKASFISPGSSSCLPDFMKFSPYAYLSWQHVPCTPLYNHTNTWLPLLSHKYHLWSGKIRRYAGFQQ